ncbi:hypothetical protein EMCRGX_G028112 [Ephydatia muelleri]
MSRRCKVLNVAEKNDVAKEVSSIMAGGRFNRREGFSKFNKIYEFDDFNILGENCTMVVTSVSGHLMELDFDAAYRSWNNCSPVTLFTAGVRKTCPENFQPIKRTLEKEVKGCKHLVLWTDGDREGENIAEEIAIVCLNVKPSIKIHRARFSEITPQSIARACSHLDVLDQRVTDAVNVRQELDLRVGCAFTRFQTIRLKQAFPAVLGEQLVSYGPCQFPTLGFVVDRYKQVQAFIPETFYKIKVTHQTEEEEKVEFNWKRVRVFSQVVCRVLHQLCLESPTAHVVLTQSKPKSKWRPLPLDTVELEKQASRKLHINAKETMRIAEKLYTQGYISYPRTETNIFPDSLDLATIISDQTMDPNWGGFAAQLLATGPNPRRGTKSDNAHPPIHPTKYTNGLQGSEQRVYEYIVRHFLACCSQDAQGQESTVEIELEAGERFSAQGLMIIAKNYLNVFPYDRWSAKTIPTYQLHSTFQPTSIEMMDGQTTPPPLLKEADLIALMEKHGIGTDATHAEHIETIKSRNYVGVLPDGGLVPGELGMGLVEGYDSMGFALSKPHLRAELEADLKRICDGVKVKEEVIQVTLDKYKDVFLNASQQAHKLDEALSKYFGISQPVAPQEVSALGDVVRPCPVCQQCDLIVKKKRDGGFMLSCSGYPNCRAVQFFPGCIASVAVDQSLCDNCQPQPVHKLHLVFKAGQVPPYIMGPGVVGCSTCDPALVNDLNIEPIRTTAPPPTGGGARGSQAAGRGRASANRGGPGTAQRGRGVGGRGRGSGGGGGGGRGGGGDGGGGGSGGGSGGSRVGGRERGGRGVRFGGSEREGGGERSGYDDGGGEAMVWTAGTSSHTKPYGTSAPSSAIMSQPANGAVCGCGQDAVLLTVRKEDSVNKGRQFYSCARREGGCGFFLWADQGDPMSRVPSGPLQQAPANNNSANSYRKPGFLAPQKRGAKVGQSHSTAKRKGSVVCTCGDQAVQRTVQKDGPNKGRTFYTCPKPRDDQCGFFEWADDLPAMGGDSQTSSSTGRKRAPPTCSVCREQGHTKRTCPQGQDT